MQDVSGNFVVSQSGVIVMDGDSLAQCFVNGLAEGIIEMGFPTQNQRECELCKKVTLNTIMGSKMS